MHALPLAQRLSLRTRSAAVAVLMLALLWAQLLGLVHGVMHARVDHAPSAVAVHAQAPVATDLLSHLLAPADDESRCRLYDQLGHSGPLPTLPQLSVHALPLVPAWVVLQALAPQPCVAFAARAPPSSR